MFDQWASGILGKFRQTLIASDSVVQVVLQQDPSTSVLAEISSGRATHRGGAA